MASNANKAQTPKVDSDLIKKYNQPVPRYTSYPTALKFCIIDDAESRHALCRDSEDDSPLSLYFHLPFCNSLCWFCGCTKIISTDSNLADVYIDYLEKEMDLVKPFLGKDRQVAQLHFGGGTPNFLTPQQLDRLTQAIHSRFDFASDAEKSVELDPRTLTQEKVEALQRLGVNRASIGVQDVNPEVQVAIHRIQSTKTNLDTIKWLKECGIDKLNIDLIYGLPCQTVESFSETLDEVIGYDPDRFALFSYAHVPWSKPAQKILERSSLPSAEEKIGMLTESMKRFKKAGYCHIGMDHFTKQNDSLAVAQRAKTLQRNFQGYSLYKDAQICGFGISAISQTRKTYRQNFKDLETYYKFLDEVRCPVERGYLLSKEDIRRRRIIMRLMCDMELDYHKMGQELELDFKSAYAKELKRLEPLAKDGLVVLYNKGFQVTDIGRLLIRNIASVFDAYLGKKDTQYSKAV